MIENTINTVAIKTRQQATWAAGDYGVIGRTLQIVGESLCEAVELRAGSRVLDVCAGNGNASLAAARRWCDVTSSDYVPALLEGGRKRAAGEGLPMSFKVADVENLPFDDDAFDVVLSTFGVMFTPDQARAASELVRACRPGGKIGLANWTPDGFIGQVFKIIGKHIAPPPGLMSPALWGTEERLQELFGKSAESIRANRCHFNFRYKSPNHFLDVFRSFYGPIHKAYSALDTEAQTGLTRDLLELLERSNRSGDATLIVPSEYLEVVVALSE